MKTALSARKSGKTSLQLQSIRMAVARGEHVHAVSLRSGTWCVNGPPDCTLRHRTLAETEHELKR